MKMLALFGLYVYILVTIGHSNAASVPEGLVKCKRNDKTCILSSAKMAWKKIIQGDPEHGIEPSDNMFIKEIIGDLSLMKYRFTDSNSTFLANCVFDNDYVNFDVENLKLKVNLLCKDLTMRGHYNASGQLLVIPIRGDGAYQLDCDKWIYRVEADLSRVKSDEKEHLSIKNFKVTSEPLEPLRVDMKNLFDGNKLLGDEVIKFANENWKEVAAEFKEPVVKAIIKKLVKNVNKYLKRIPANELYLD